MAEININDISQDIDRNNIIPDVSIIVPVYNAASYINDCIASVLIQSFKNFELLLINDGSHDGSEDICKQAAQNDSRIHLLSCSESQGVSHARNMGIDAAVGKYLVFLDADDMLHPQFLEQMWLQGEQSNSDMVVVEYARYEDDNHKLWEEISERPLVPQWIIWNGDEIWSHWYSIRSRNGVWAKLFRKDSLQDLCFDENLSFAEDFQFTHTFLRKGNIQISYSNSLGYCYRIRKDSSCHYVSIDRLKSWIQIKSTMRDYELSQGRKENALIMEREILTQIREWLFEQGGNREDTKNVRALLVKERKNPLYKELSFYKRTLNYLCLHFLPLYRLLYSIKLNIRR